MSIYQKWFILLIPLKVLIDRWKIYQDRTVFLTDDSLRKSLYLATEIIIQKWKSLIPNWELILSQFMIMFDDRLDKNEII